MANLLRVLSTYYIVRQGASYSYNSCDDAKIWSRRTLFNYLFVWRPIRNERTVYYEPNKSLRQITSLCPFTEWRTLAKCLWILQKSKAKVWWYAPNMHLSPAFKESMHTYLKSVEPWGYTRYTNGITNPILANGSEFTSLKYCLLWFQSQNEEN